jgi:hypothetical protein
MAYLESAVVVYLRVIMYPQGFSFPLAPMKNEIALTEIIREAATIIMLAGAGYLGGRFFAQRFAFFIYCFAIWDIFYYVFLKLLIGWPQSLLSWDILFLIPVIWTGPVLSPVIVSLTMILLTGVILYCSKENKIYINFKEWFLLITGSIILIISFTWDYMSFALNYLTFAELIKIYGSSAFIEISDHYVPVRFPWVLFAMGELLLTTVIIMLFLRYKRFYKS